MGKYWNDEEFKKAVNECSTISDVLRRFNIPVNQGYYNKVFHDEIKKLELSIDHFSKRTPPSNAWTFEKIFTKDSKYKGGSSSLKNKLIKNLILENKCSECGLEPEWNGKKLSMHLDHINGEPTDNRIENLRILCPNCHSQTETYCGSKKRKKKHAYKFECKKCRGQKKTTSSLYCISCSKDVIKSKAKPKIKWPDIEILKKMLEDSNFVQVGKKLGVSDNAVRKHLKKHGGR